MAKPYYVKFEMPESLVSPIYESLRVAVETGKVKRGTNEATKAIERGVSKLVIIAEDVEPPEVVAHLPIICEEQGAAYAFVPSKQELGKALGIETTSAACAILDSGDAQHIIDEVIASIAKIKGGKSEPAAKPEATEPAAKPEATEPAAKPEATEPAAKPEQ
jgi:large subunit ribosomal protein L7Ae